MNGPQTSVDGTVTEAVSGWDVIPVDPARGVFRLRDGHRSVTVVVEGAGTDWFVTIHGRRVPVTVRTWRERLLAEAETSAGAHAGPTVVTATLPGLVASVDVRVGDVVGAGSPLLTLEAMKMQNEVRAPRAGRVAEVHVTAGQTVATGARLLRLE